VSSKGEPVPCLTPADVASRLQCGVRSACRIMREAGGFRLGESWRLREPAFRAWLERREAATQKAAAAPARGSHTAEVSASPLASFGLPGNELKPLRHTQPRTRKAAR
jgi:hypothetical protein